MTFSNYFIAVVLVGCAERHDPCDGAKSGEACRWAGTGAEGYNRGSPNSDRLTSQLDEPTDVTFGPDGRAYITDWNNHAVRRVEHDQTLRLVIGNNTEGDSDQPDQLDHTSADG